MSPSCRAAIGPLAAASGVFGLAQGDRVGLLGHVDPHQVAAEVVGDEGPQHGEDLPGHGLVVEPFTRQDADHHIAGRAEILHLRVGNAGAGRVVAMPYQNSWSVFDGAMPGLAPYDFLGEGRPPWRCWQGCPWPVCRCPSASLPRM